MNIPVIILLLAGLVVAAVFCVVIRNLLKAAIALSALSGILAVVMFMMGAPMAAVFELSVCAGLITVVLISAISMTRVRSKEEQEEQERTRRKRFRPLPVALCILLTVALLWAWPHLDELLTNTSQPMSSITEQEFFWHQRQADILGQIVIVLAGVFGVLIFFKEKEREEK